MIVFCRFAKLVEKFLDDRGACIPIDGLSCVSDWFVFKRELHFRHFDAWRYDKIKHNQATTKGAIPDGWLPFEYVWDEGEDGHAKEHKRWDEKEISVMDWTGIEKYL